MDEHIIDVNKASVEVLEKLKGVGRAKAEAIISTREGLGVFHSIEEILQVPGIGRNLLEQNRDTLKCSLSGTPLTRQINSLRRSLRRSQAATSERSDVVNRREDTMINSSDKDTSCTKPGRGGSGGIAGGSDSSSSSSRSTNKMECTGRRTKVVETVEEEEEDDEGEDEKEDELLGFDFEEEKEENIADIDCSSDIVYVINRNGKGGVRENNRSSFRSENSIGSGLGSDTPHEEGISDTPLDVPLSPMRLTDGETDEQDEELEGGKAPLEEELMVVDQAASQCPDKKQNKRKSEVCTDSKGSCPVKKTCKAVDTSDACDRVKSSSHFCHKYSSPPGLKTWLSKYQTWSQSQKLYALDSLIDICDLGQVRHIHQTILPQFQRDFISLLPKELALYVLSFLEPKDLLRAAQTCKYWNILAADNLLWREKCREAGLEDHIVVLNQRRKKGTCVSHMSPFKAAFMRQHRIEMNWRLNPLCPPRILKGHDDHVITCLQFCGNTVVSGSDDNTLKVWDATTGKCMRTLTGHTGGVWSSQMADNLIVSGSTDRMLRVWNATTGDCIYTLYGHTSTVRCLHLHGKKVVSGSRDATLRVWDITTGSCEHVLTGHVAAVRCVQYNGKLVVSGAYDYMVKVWNPEREECIHTLQGHTNRVYSLQFDGVHVVTGSLDTSIRVWDVETGQCRHTLMGHQSLTSGMELKNNILISGNADSTVKVWDILTGQCLQTLSGPHKHRSAVTCLQFNNKFVVTSSDDGTVKLWDVKTGEFIRNLVALDSGGSGGVVWRIRASDTKLVCAVGSRNGTEETKLLVLDFDVYENAPK